MRDGRGEGGGGETTSFPVLIRPGPTFPDRMDSMHAVRTKSHPFFGMAAYLLLTTGAIMCKFRFDSFTHRACARGYEKLAHVLERNTCTRVNEGVHQTNEKAARSGFRGTNRAACLSLYVVHAYPDARNIIWKRVTMNLNDSP